VQAGRGDHSHEMAVRVGLASSSSGVVCAGPLVNQEAIILFHGHLGLSIISFEGFGEDAVGRQHVKKLDVGIPTAPFISVAGGGQTPARDVGRGRHLGR